MLSFAQFLKAGLSKSTRGEEVRPEDRTLPKPITLRQGLENSTRDPWGFSPAWTLWSNFGRRMCPEGTRVEYFFTHSFIHLFIP